MGGDGEKINVFQINASLTKPLNEICVEKNAAIMAQVRNLLHGILISGLVVDCHNGDQTCVFLKSTLHQSRRQRSAFCDRKISNIKTLAL